jgi:glutamine synthetase
MAELNSVEHLERQIADDDLTALWIVFHDYAARACAKWAPRAAIPDALRTGGTFCKANLNFTIDDQQVPTPRFAADAGDFFAVPDPATYCVLPYRPGVGRVLSFLHTEDGELWEGCPRGQLLAALDRLKEYGLSIRAAFEPEFSLFLRTANGYEPADGYSMYSVDRIDAFEPFLTAVESALTAQRVHVTQVGSEYGSGQVEINLHHEHPLKAADDLLTLRETVKALARDAGLVASFMPKPFAHLAGSGVHVHLSLWDAEGRSDRSAGDGPGGLSVEMQRFMAGVLEHARGLCGISAPTVNSYKRLLPGSWAPAHVAWAVGNRAALVRVPGPRRPRFEFRAGDHTANPYLVLAGLVAAGLDGLNRELRLPPEAAGDIGHADAETLEEQGITRLPRSAGEALDAIEADATLMSALGPICGPELLRIKRHELARYETHVSEWEREVYLERV